MKSLNVSQNKNLPNKSISESLAYYRTPLFALAKSLVTRTNSLVFFGSELCKSHGMVGVSFVDSGSTNPRIR